MELALLLGCGRSQYTGYCTNVINTTAAEKAGVPVFDSVGATAGAKGGDGWRAKSRLYLPVRAAQTSTSSTE